MKTRKLHYQIDNFDFATDKSIKIIYGGGESHLMNLAEWHKIHKSYYDRFFGCDLHKVITIASYGNNIVETLRKWCSKNHGKGIIVEGYDLILNILIFWELIHNISPAYHHTLNVINELLYSIIVKRSSSLFIKSTKWEKV